jgi:hypothetical protein
MAVRLQYGVDIVRSVGPSGLLIGRSGVCDLVLANPHVSGRQALIRHTPQGAELISIGRNPTAVGGKKVADRVNLVDGDAIELPGTTLTVHIDPVDDRPTWMVLDPLGLGHPIRGDQLQIGEGSRADLQAIGGGVALHPRGKALVADPGAGVSLDGEELMEDVPVEVPAGATLTVGQTDFLIVAEAPAGSDTTRRIATPELPCYAELAFLPTGGKLTLQVGSETMQLSLSELRARLVAILLGPPSGHTPGDYIPDEVILPAVWPRQPEKTHTDLNLLLHRVRRSLLKAGANPTRVLERAPQGGALRFCLARDAEVKVH